MSIPSTSQATSATASFTVRLAPALPGTYRDTIQVTSAANRPDAGVRGYITNLTVHYTVTPNDAVDVVFAPAQGSYTVTQGSDAHAVTGYVAVSKPLALPSYVGVDYLSRPAAADGNPLATSWWLDDFRTQGVRPCADLGSGRQCLPAGTYTAREHWRLNNGSGADIYWPITLQVQ